MRVRCAVRCAKVTADRTPMYPRSADVVPHGRHLGNVLVGYDGDLPGHGGWPSRYRWTTPRIWWHLPFPVLPMRPHSNDKVPACSFPSGEHRSILVQAFRSLCDPPQTQTLRHGVAGVLFLRLPPSPVYSVVVMPFINLGDREQDYFARRRQECLTTICRASRCLCHRRHTAFPLTRA